MSPDTAFDIIKVVDFPAPIADIVNQHHERMDGSGYQLGLKGEEILPESRTLALVHVVEATASHRLCRPALAHSGKFQSPKAKSQTRIIKLYRAWNLELGASKFLHLTAV